MTAIATTPSAFGALVSRDLLALRREAVVFLVRTFLQPLMLLFVFTNLLPRIGAARAFGDADLTYVVIPGVMGMSIFFQALQSLSLSLILEIEVSGEIDDRVLSPVPLRSVLLARLVSGSLQCLLSGLLVLPLAHVVPREGISLDIDVLVLLTMLPLCSVAASAIGLAMGASLDTTQAPLLFGVITIPATFLGAIYFTWGQLEDITWLRYVVLVNPLVYMNEGLRAALGTGSDMPLALSYGALIALVVALVPFSVRQTERRLRTIAR